jgi:hypothetical protein
VVDTRKRHDERRRKEVESKKKELETQHLRAFD